MSSDSLTQEPFEFRDNGRGSYYITGPSDYMLRRGIDLCWDLSQGNLSGEFRREESDHGERLVALAIFILADWAENPCGDGPGFCGCTVFFPRSAKLC